VRFLIRDGWLAHYLNFAGERMLPTMPKLLEAPFWLDLGDPHRMASAMQLLTKPRALDWYTPFDLRDRLVGQEAVWPKAVHRVVTGGITPEQAVVAEAHRRGGSGKHRSELSDNSHVSSWLRLLKKSGRV
jgi:hypothetical protein